MNVLAGKHCLLTGATGGLGRHIARALMQAGCHLFLTSTSREKLEILRQELAAGNVHHSLILFKEADLCSEPAITAMLEDAAIRFDHIDILINCAGIFLHASLAEATVEDFDRIFQINVRAPFLLAKACVGGMQKNGWGRIVNIGSSSAYQGFKDTSLYCASKHALLGFSRAWYDELKHENIRVFSLSPGSIKTEMGQLIQHQDVDTFIAPEEAAAYLVFVIGFDREMISEEIRMNRLIIR